MGERAKGIELYVFAIKEYEEIVAKSDYAYAKGNFATALIDFAELLVRNSQTNEARTRYVQALTILKSQDESSVDDEDLARANFGLGEIIAGSKLPADGPVKAAEYYRNSLSHLQKIESAGRLSARSSKLLDTVNSKIAGAE